MKSDEVRAETVRMRGFIRAAETQSTKILALLDEPEEPPIPEPEPGPEPAPDPGSNEPAGFTTIGEHAFATVNEGGWGPLWDPTGAFSIRSGVGRVDFRKGLPTSGSLRPISLPKRNWAAREFFFSFDLTVSPNWQGHKSGVNKIFYVTGGVDSGAGAPVYFLLEGSDQHTLTFAVHRQNPHLSPAQNAYTWDSAANEIRPPAGAATIVRGRRTTIEVHVIANTPGSSDGEIHAWVDGTKILEFTSVLLYAAEDAGVFSNIRWEPIWGGQGDEVEEDMYQDMHHMRLSTRGST